MDSFRNVVNASSSSRKGQQTPGSLQVPATPKSISPSSGLNPTAAPASSSRPPSTPKSPAAAGSITVDKQFDVLQTYYKPSKKTKRKNVSDNPFKRDYEKVQKKGKENIIKNLTLSEQQFVQAPKHGDPLRITPTIYGRPVEEVDPFIFDDTFCAISKKFNKHYVFRFSAKKSLFLFGPMNPLRRLCIFVSTHQVFDFFIICVILANCVALAMDSNEFTICKEGLADTHQCKDESDYGDLVIKESSLPKVLEWSFLFIYGMEFVVKVIAKGFILDKYSYLRNGWNVFDLLVIIFGFATEIIVIVTDRSHHLRDLVDLDIFRTFRALRALKTVSILPGLRMMISALMNSFKQLFEVMVLIFFALFVFSLFALEVFSGKFHNVCVLNKGSDTAKALYRLPNMKKIDYNDLKDFGMHHDYRKWIMNPTNWHGREVQQFEHYPCSNESGARHCPEDYTCLPNLNKNPDYGWTSFDSFFESMLSTYQLVTLDYWERLFDLVVSSSGPMCLPFFLVVVFMGSFYLLNLMLAVVTMSYEAEASTYGSESSNNKPLTKRQKLTLHRSNSTFSFDDPLRLHITPLIGYRRRTPIEREVLARQLRHITAEKYKRKTGYPDSAAAETLNDIMIDVLDRKLAAARELDPDPIEQEDIHIQEIQLAGASSSGSEFEWEEETAGNDEDNEPEEDEVSLNDEFAIFEDDPPIPEPSKSLVNIPTSDRNVSVIDQPLGVEIETPSMMSKKETMSMAEHKQRNRARRRASQQVLTKVQLKLVMIVNHHAVEWFITACIVLNTILLASEHHMQPDWLGRLISFGSHSFTIVYTIEAILKIVALRKEYFRSPWNLFDLAIVIASFLDLLLESVTSISGFRVLRLMRIFKLAQSWVTMKILLNIIFDSFSALGNLVLLVVIVIFIFAVLGMQVVGKQYIPRNFGAMTIEDENFPRWHFRNFWYSFMMVFRVLCGEWIEPLWDCLVAHKAENEQYKCFIIFLPILIIGNFIVLNLFLALLLNSFTSEELKAQREKEREASERVDNLKRIVGIILSSKKRAKQEAEKEQDAIALVIALRAEALAARAKKEKENAAGSGSESGESGTASETENGPPKEDSPERIEARRHFRKVMHNVVLLNRKNAAQVAIAKMEENEWRREAGKAPIGDLASADKGYEDYIPGVRRKIRFARTMVAGKRSKALSFHGTSLLSVTTAGKDIEEETKLLTLEPCCPVCCRSHKVQCCIFWDHARYRALKIVSSTYFDHFILILIIAQSVVLCFEDLYMESNSERYLIIMCINAGLTFLFLVEMIMKWMAYGLDYYFKDAWTLLDFIIVYISVVNIIVDVDSEAWEIREYETESSSSLSSFKALRTLRALRPLRIASKWQGMKVVCNALVYAIPSILNVLLVCMLFWLVFAIMGVNLFKGKFYKCIYTKNESTVHYDIVKNITECCARNDSREYYDGAMSWINIVPNFDNVLYAYLSLFQLATFEGWMEIMAAATDVGGRVNDQPRRDSGLIYYVFFVAFIVFGSFFTLQLFIGVIIDNFNVLKKKYEGNLVEALLTPTQRNYYTAMKKLGRRRPQKIIHRPTNKCLALFYDIAMSRKFEILIFAMIFLNMLTMAFEHHNQREIYVDILEGLNAYFTAFYLIECVIKLIGLRHYYFTAAWNILDFILVIASIVDLFISDSKFEFPFPPTLLRVVRVFRIGRVLRLIKAAKGIRKLLFALIVSLPALFNIAALLALISFVYAILGLSYFSHAQRYDPVIDSVHSFETFYQTVLMLFRLFTAAGWNEVLDAYLDVDVYCGDYRKFKCGREGEPECTSSDQVVGFMVSYIFISNLIVINMYIAVILENFAEANRDEEVGIVEDDLEAFYNHWSRFDPDATQFIGFEKLSTFLAMLDPPLDIPKPNIVAIVSFNLPIARGNKIHCLDILYALIKHVLGQVEDSEEFRKVQDQMERQFRKQFPTRKLIDIISSTRVWKVQHNAAIVIQRAWREYKKRQLIKAARANQSSIFKTRKVKKGNFFHHASDERKEMRSPIPDPGAFVLAGTGFSNRRVSTVGTNPPAPHKK